MKYIKLLGIGMLTLVISFFTAFLGLEIYKHAGAQDLFRAHTPYDLVIKNARIIDGADNNVFRGDIGIRGDKIIDVAKYIDGRGMTVFDAAGFTVAPEKVEWPETISWVERDLATAILRYPTHRIIIKKASEVDWRGRSVKAILSEGQATFDDLTRAKSTRVIIAPDFTKMKDNNSITAFYIITGWRGEIMDQKVGKIKKGFPANLVVFNHRNLKEEVLLSYLQQEKLPPIEYRIEGSTIQSTNTNS